MATLNVQNYGAVGDGQNNDQPAVQSAIDDASEGDTILFPETDNFYRIRSPYIEIHGDTHSDNLTLIGEGECDSMLRMEGDHTGGNAMIRIRPQTSGIEGLEIRNLHCHGNRQSQNSNWNHIIFPDGADSSRAEVDILIKNVELQSASRSAIMVRCGGVTIERCTIHEVVRQPIGLATGGEPVQDPPATVRHCHCYNHGWESPRSWVGIDSTDGKSIVEDTVIGPSAGRGFKCSVGHNEHEYRRVRVTECAGGGALSTNPTSGYMHFEDIVVEGCGSDSFGTFRFDNIDYSVEDGSEIVITDNLNDSGNAGMYIYDGATFDAENADIYVNRTDSSSGSPVGIRASDTTGEIGYYGHYDNSGGATGSLSGLSIGTQERADKTDIESVPTADEVGVWTEEEDSESEEESEPDRNLAPMGGIATSGGSLQTASGVLDTQFVAYEERYLEITADDDMAEYEITVEGSAEAGDDANTHEHEYQDTVTTDGDYTIIHGYVSSSGGDDYYIEGRIVDAQSDNPVTVRIDGEEYELEEIVEEPLVA